MKCLGSLRQTCAREVMFFVTPSHGGILSLRSRPFLLAVIFAGAFPHLSLAAINGTNVPATPLTAERVADLPAWRDYLAKSQRQRQADRDFFLAELRVHGLKDCIEPGPVHNAGGLNLEKPPLWYAGAEARRIAGNLVSFQTPAGGWCKNTDFAGHRRGPGEMFDAQSGSLFLGTNDFDTPENARWSYIGTFDNDATTTELRFLARVIAAAKTGADDLKASFYHGLDYIFSAQFPNGGWPQVWPLQGGYHDTVTFNDDAMILVLELLRDVAGGQGDFSFVPAEWRAKADAGWKRGLDCLLAAQLRVGGKLTVWCQQYDAITLQPASARNYEMPAQVSSESAVIVLFLMRLPQPDARVVASVHAACAWFERTKITGRKFAAAGSDGKKLVAAPGGGPIWSRFYEMGTDRPVFGDRDKSIHDDVNEISRERRNGYGWFRDTPRRVLQHYARWVRTHPMP